VSKELDQWIGFSDQKPKQVVPMFESEGSWIYLKQPISQWPKNLQYLWNQELSYLFEMEVEARDFLGEQRLCLCIDTHDCGEKSSEMENRDCLYYARGICLAATHLASEIPISFGLMGRLFGISKQRVQQIYAGAQKKIIKKILADPFLKEYCLGLGLGALHLPSAESLSEEIDSLLNQ
jgi:hypothetical protein